MNLVTIAINEVNIILMVGNVILYEKQSPDKVLWKSDVCHDPKNIFVFTENLCLDLDISLNQRN